MGCLGLRGSFVGMLFTMSLNWTWKALLFVRGSKEGRGSVKNPLKWNLLAIPEFRDTFFGNFHIINTFRSITQHLSLSLSAADVNIEQIMRESAPPRQLCHWLAGLLAGLLSDPTLTRALGTCLIHK